MIPTRPRCHGRGALRHGRIGTGGDLKSCDRKTTTIRNDQERPMTVLTDRYTRAVDYARVAHAEQTRKGTRIPYLYHLLAVSSLVLEFGGNEDQAIAALLHDVIE